MIRRRTIAVHAALALLVLGGCRDGVGPEAGPDSVRIYLGGTPYDEQTIPVGETLELEARVLDPTGDEVPGERVTWTTEAPGIATVGEAGLVTALDVGTARIIARHSVGSDTALVTVAVAYTRDELPLCGSAAAFAPGEMAQPRGAETLPICLGGGAEGAEYTMVVVNGGSTAASVLRIGVDAAGVADGMVSTSREGRGAAALAAGPLPDERFHRRLRGEVSRRLEPRLRAGVRMDPPDAPALQVVPGQRLSFNVETASSNGCTNPDRRGGRVRAIGTHAVAVADTLNPVGGYDDADYAEFVEFFDEEVWPLVTGTFGTPSDIDGNGKVFIFFTRAVNELPANRNGDDGSYIGGFFFNRDLFPTSSCEGSNAAEMFYMLVPNPSPGPGEGLFTRSDVERSTRNVLVHEFQHLVNDSRRLHVNRAPVWEETWLNEGLSHIAEELMFYERSGLRPRTNIGPAELFGSAAAMQALEVFQIDNFARLQLFLTVPRHSSLMGADLLTTRGATWSFLRYAADRRGGSEAAFWDALVRNARTSGLENLRQALGAEPTEWIRDWGAALYLDDTPWETAETSFASWRLRDVYASYRLQPERLYSVEDLRMNLQGGGVAYLRAAVAAGETASIRFYTGEGSGPYLPLPDRASVLVIRTK